MPEEASEDLPHAGPGDVRDYIRDMLAQLADMAAAGGDPRLAETVRKAAVEVERIDA